MIKALTDEMNFHKKEVQLLKSEKETLQAVLTMKTADVKDSLHAELKKIEDEMKRHFAHQKVDFPSSYLILGLKSPSCMLKEILIYRQGPEEFFAFLNLAILN